MTVSQFDPQTGKMQVVSRIVTVPTVAIEGTRPSLVEKLASQPVAPTVIARLGDPEMYRDYKPATPPVTALYRDYERLSPEEFEAAHHVGIGGYESLGRQVAYEKRVAKHPTADRLKDQRQPVISPVASGTPRTDEQAMWALAATNPIAAVWIGATHAASLALGRPYDPQIVGAVAATLALGAEGAGTLGGKPATPEVVSPASVRPRLPAGRPRILEVPTRVLSPNAPARVLSHGDPSGVSRRGLDDTGAGPDLRCVSDCVPDEPIVVNAAPAETGNGRTRDGPPRSNGDGGTGGRALRQQILVVGAERADEFAYATEAAGRGAEVTVVNPHATTAAQAFKARGGNFVHGRVEDLARVQFDLIREDFPVPTGRAWQSTVEFAAERLGRLAPGGQWIVATEALEFASTLRAAATIAGFRSTVREIPSAHEATPHSPHLRESTRYILIFDRP